MAQKLKDHVVFHNGQKMPIIGLGTLQATGEEIETAINAALEAGYRHIDTAYIYQNEAAIGKVLKKWIDSGKVKRENLFIVTKLPAIGNRAESVEKYIKRQLAALQLDYVDLYLIHTPTGYQEKGESILPNNKDGKPLFDMTTDHISLWKAMEAQVDAGRAKAIGLSNFNARQIKRIYKSARIPPANLQIELNLSFQQRELAAFCNALDITVCAFAPLGAPAFPELLKKYNFDLSKFTFYSPLTEPVVLKIAKKHNKTAAQILLRHTIQRGIVVIPKSTNPARIKENIQIFDFELSPEDVDELDALDKGSKARVFGGTQFPGFDEHPEFAFNDPY